MKKCGNRIVVFYWKTGQIQILGSYEQAKSYFNMKMNGEVKDEICDGNIEITIRAESIYRDYTELNLFFQCNKCGKTYQVENEYETIEKIHRIINENMEQIL